MSAFGVMGVVRALYVYTCNVYVYTYIRVGGVKQVWVSLRV